MDKLDFEKIWEALKYDKIYTDPLEIKISEEYKILLDEFKPLLREVTNNKELTSEEVNKLWRFFMIGINVKNMEDQEEILDKLISFKNPIEYTENISEIIRKTDIYEFYHRTEIYKKKGELYRKLKDLKIFESDDPVTWYRCNNCSYDLPELSLNYETNNICKTIMSIINLNPLYRM